MKGHFYMLADVELPSGKCSESVGAIRSVAFGIVAKYFM